MPAHGPGAAAAPGDATAGIDPGAAPVFSQASALHPPLPNPPRKSRRMRILAAGIAGILAMIWLASLLGKQAGELAPAPSAATPAVTLPSSAPPPSSPASSPASLPAPSPAAPPAPVAAATPDAQSPADVAPIRPAPAASAGPPAAAPQPEPDTTALAVQRRLRELEQDAALERAQATDRVATQATPTPRPAHSTETAAAAPVRQDSTPAQAEVLPSPLSPPVSQAEIPAAEPRREAPARTDASTLLGNVSAFERISIEMSCSAQRTGSGPGQYESCLRHQLASLAASPGRPNLLQASREDQVAIENACAHDKRESGPAQYYQCLRRELGQRGYAAGASEGRGAAAAQPGPTAPAARTAATAPPAPAPVSPDAILAGTNTFERVSIEQACASEKAAADPSNYHSCLRWQMVNLSRSGRPDLSSATPAELLALENACSVEKNRAGPVPYYDCLRREMNRLGVE